MRIVIYQDRAGEYRWKLVAANGHNVGASGEGYTRKADARRAARKFLLAVRIVEA